MSEAKAKTKVRLQCIENEQACRETEIEMSERKTSKTRNEKRKLDASLPTPVYPSFSNLRRVESLPSEMRIHSLAETVEFVLIGEESGQREREREIEGQLWRVDSTRLDFFKKR